MKFSQVLYQLENKGFYLERWVNFRNNKTELTVEEWEELKKFLVDLIYILKNIDHKFFSSSEGLEQK